MHHGLAAAGRAHVVGDLVGALEQVGIDRPGEVVVGTPLRMTASGISSNSIRQRFHSIRRRSAREDRDAVAQPVERDAKLGRARERLPFGRAPPAFLPAQHQSAADKDAEPEHAARRRGHEKALLRFLRLALAHAQQPHLVRDHFLDAGADRQHQVAAEMGLHLALGLGETGIVVQADGVVHLVELLLDHRSEPVQLGLLLRIVDGQLAQFG